MSPDKCDYVVIIKSVWFCFNALLCALGIVHCVSRNVPTLASCSIDKHGLVLIILVYSTSTLFLNDLHVQLSLSLYFYLLYLLLDSCDGNDAFWCHSMLVTQLSSFSTKHRTSFVQQICVCQTVWLTTEFGDWCRNVCPQHQRLKEMPHGNNGAFFRAYTLKPALFRATNSLPRKTRCFMSFPLCYLKANKVSKSEGTRTVEHAYNFLKVCSCRLPKIIKISPCLSKLQLAKVGMFFLDTVYVHLSHIIKHYVMLSGRTDFM